MKKKLRPHVQRKRNGEQTLVKKKKKNIEYLYKYIGIEKIPSFSLIDILYAVCVIYLKMCKYLKKCGWTKKYIYIYIYATHIYLL